MTGGASTGGSDITGGTTASGGSSGSGGVPTGGVSTTGGTPGSGGIATGGAATGGLATGGMSTGGAATGGTATGGVATGGMATGGAQAGGAETGGAESGGADTGGTESGGSSTTTIPGDGCTPPAAYANLFVAISGHTEEETDAKIEAAWSQLYNPSNSNTVYYDGPGSDESYVKDIGNNDVRTEGMSYGMMIAVQMDKQTEFDRMWTWVRNHMASGCSASGCTGTQIAWKCSTSGSKLATGGAPDGDEYFAAALVFAHNRWGDTSGKFNYKPEAKGCVQTADDPAVGAEIDRGDR
jgi:hypothetical protein